MSIKGVPGRYANFHLRATVTRMKRASRAEPSSHPHSSADPAGVANSSGAACLADDSAAPRGPARRRGRAMDKLIGRRVSVKAVDDLQFFKGTVIRFNYYREGNRHYVRYDDGVEDWEDLSLNELGSSWDFLPEEDGEPTAVKISKASPVTKSISKDTKADCQSKTQQAKLRIKQMPKHPATANMKAKVEPASKLTPKKMTKLIYRRYKGKDIKPAELWRAVKKLGGFDFVIGKRHWQRVRKEMATAYTAVVQHSNKPVIIS